MHKKRIAAYFLFIGIGLSAAFFFLRNKNTVVENDSTLAVKDSVVIVSLLSEFYDLENNGDGFASTEKAASGKKSCKLSASVEYGLSVIRNVKDIPSFSSLKSISVSFKSTSASKEDDALYVLSIDDANGKNIHWDGKPFVSANDKDWTDVTIDFPLDPALLDPGNRITLYPWNRVKKDFFVDDITIEYMGTASVSSISAASEKANLFFDFETEAGLSTAEGVSEMNAHSGKKACGMLKGKEYGPSVSKKLSEIGASFPKKIALSVWVYPLTDSPDAVLTVSVVNKKNESLCWEGEGTANKDFPKNKWTKINALFVLPSEKFSPDDVITVNVWNKGKTDVIVDDLEIVYGEAPERRGTVSKIDMTAIYEKRFTGEKNKPPFNTIWFNKTEIGNNNKSTITADSKDVLSPNDQFLCGDFFIDKYALDEILCINASGQALYSYSSEGKQFKKLWSNTNINDSLWNNNNDFYCGDMNADGKADILSVGKKDNSWSLLNFNGKIWIIVSKGKDPKKEWTATKQLPKGPVIAASDIVMPGNYYGNKQTFLKLNTDWRFDLKLIEQDGNGYTILGNADFKGYPADHNPKYYELVKLVTGKFISKDKTAVLVIMCNCADRDFDGRKCRETEDLPFLPNSTQMYSIEGK
jgi:hypothetical protein